MKNKGITIIKEVIPERYERRLQDLAQEIFDVNDDYVLLEKELHELKRVLKDRESYIKELERSVIDQTKMNRYYEREINTMQDKYLTEKRYSELLRYNK